MAYEIHQLPQKFFTAFLIFSSCGAAVFTQYMTRIPEQSYVFVFPH